jgi:glycosyltransferase involved in cell wall biosynthesis
MVENKRQHLLLEALWHLKRMYSDQALRLVLVGGITSQKYHHQVLARICELGLEYDITLTGKCSDAHLHSLYRRSSVMWCVSEHEGFCIPLVEANFFCVPVLSFATSNIPDTLGESGVLIEDQSPITLASTTVSILHDATLAATVVDAGKRNLLRYTEEALSNQLQDYLLKHDITA